jgi:hypothetical protein
MPNVTSTDPVFTLRGMVFEAVEAWNTAHPHPLGSRREHATVNVTQVYADTSGTPSYTITVACALSGSAQLTFHGHDLATVAEHACLTLEHRIPAELQRRAEKLLERAFDRSYGVAV